MRPIIHTIGANLAKAVAELTAIVAPLASLAAGKVWIGDVTDDPVEEQYNAPTALIVRPDDTAPAYNVRTTFAAALAAIQRGSASAGRIIADELAIFPYVGAHDGGAASATYIDSAAGWTPSALIGQYIWNQTDGSWGLITANTATVVTAALYGGSARAWDPGDGAVIGHMPTINSGPIVDLTGISLASMTEIIGAFVIEDGATIEKLVSLELGAALRSSSSSAAWSPSSPFGARFRINGGHLVGSHLAPVIEVGDGQNLELQMVGGSLGGDYQNPHPAIHVVGGGQLKIYMRGGANIKAHTLSGDDAGDVQIYVYDGASSVDLDQDFAVGTINPDSSQALPQHANEHLHGGTQELLIEALGSQAQQGYVPTVNTEGGIQMKPMAPVSPHQTGDGAVPVTDQLTITDTITPPAGEYNVFWEATVIGVGTNTGYFGIYKNENLVGYQRTRTLSPVQHASVSVNARIDANGTDVITAKAVATNATGFTMGSRSMTLSAASPVP